ncbi:MAG: TolC family protein [Prolixibacteraceae bacterium]|jgi:outer membrane protein|nr:TolC family protein [Prolixibacteraceae bacterium]MBT6763191.1 TolC family protein [Prolixibacteraceae bacterium]MBT7000807.1 TolC family protein [Prolixibacteraceae bacterium]MBT7397010.1 TolC family protein [Prolixibacteraceae bacterium]
MKKKSSFILLVFLCAINPLFAQNDTIKYVLNLDDVIGMAISQSSAIKYVQNQNINYYWRYRNFKTRFRPQLVLSGDLPDYSHTTSPITQPDGSIEFKQVSNLAASTTLSLNQSIPQLGTYIWAGTSAYGIRNLKNSENSFSGSPFALGFTQPLFAYNWMKWYRKTEPMIYDEAQKRFIEQIEEIALTSTYYYFNYLTVQTNFNLAESSLKNSQDNLKISQTKKELGQISENDHSRIKLSVLNAQKALNQASMDLKNADFELKKYIGLDGNQDIELEIPLNISLFEIDPKLALVKAKENRKETTYFERRLINADRELAQAKSSTGLNATLRGSFGLSNSAEDFAGIYDQPEKDRTLRVSLSVPILDWGRSASTVKLAESEREITIYDVNKDIEDFDRGVIVQVEQFSLLKDQLKTATEADKVAGNGYLIALKKFQNGELSITDLNIALQEREKAKRDYIRSIQNYWVAYYRLRELTLYDFEEGHNINYGNPMM